jgi:capsular polysaccharide biosynthesis protein
MEIRRYISIIRRRLILVIAIVAAALAAGYFITPRSHTYTATSTLYVGSRSIDIAPQSGQVSADRAAGLDRLVQTFTALVPTRPVADAALKATGVNLTPDQVIGSTKAEQVTNANLIRVSFTDSDRNVSAVMANGIASAFVNQIRGFEPRPSATDQVISVYDTARGPGSLNPSGLPRNVALAGVFGLIAAGAVLALLEYLDITVRSADDAERLLELPVLAVIPASANQLPISTAVTVREGLLRAEPPPPRGGAQFG